MTKSFLTALAFAVTASIFADTAAAQSTPLVDHREKRQSHRIYNGVQDGSLSYRETGHLLRGQAKLRRTERRFKADGVVTRGERVRLHGRLNHQGRRIFRARHN